METDKILIMKFLHNQWIESPENNMIFTIQSLSEKMKKKGYGLAKYDDVKDKFYSIAKRLFLKNYVKIIREFSEKPKKKHRRKIEIKDKKSNENEKKKPNGKFKIKRNSQHQILFYVDEKCINKIKSYLEAKGQEMNYKFFTLNFNK